MEALHGQIPMQCVMGHQFIGMTALIVDDEPHVRAYVRLLLLGCGVTTMWEAANGAQALELYVEHRPTVVFLDVNMPVMSGPETMERLVAMDPAVAVVVITSENAIETAKRFQRLGAISYILKHAPREEASRLIAEALESLHHANDTAPTDSGPKTQ